MESTSFHDRLAGAAVEEFPAPTTLDLEATSDALSLPLGWSRSDWNLRVLADRTPDQHRSDEQWEILDREVIWPD